MVIQSVFRTVPVKHAVPLRGQTKFQIPLGIELLDDHGVTRHEYGEADVMLARHFVRRRNKPLVVADFHFKLILSLGLFGLQRHELFAAAADLRPFQRKKQIAARGADVEFHLFQIAAAFLLLRKIAAKKALGVHAERGAKLRQKRNVGRAAAGITYLKILVSFNQFCR